MVSGNFREKQQRRVIPYFRCFEHHFPREGVLPHGLTWKYTEGSSSQALKALSNLGVCTRRTQSFSMHSTEETR